MVMCEVGFPVVTRALPAWSPRALCLGREGLREDSGPRVGHGRGGGSESRVVRVGPRRPSHRHPWEANDRCGRSGAGDGVARAPADPTWATPSWTHSAAASWLAVASSPVYAVASGRINSASRRRRRHHVLHPAPHSTQMQESPRGPLGHDGGTRLPSPPQMTEDAQPCAKNRSRVDASASKAGRPPGPGPAPRLAGRRGMAPASPRTST